MKHALPSRAPASPAPVLRARALAAAVGAAFGLAGVALAQAPATPPAVPSAPAAAPAPPATAPAPAATPSAAPLSATITAPEGTATQAPRPLKALDIATPAAAIAALGWLEGCWKGSVNGRDFRENWLPLAGGMLVGAGQTVYQGRTQDYEYVRIELRADGVYYVNLPSGEKESTYRLAMPIQADEQDTIFTFANTVPGFPERIVYRRGAEGWLYAMVEGTLNGEKRNVIYPMRRVGCESGELIRK